MPTPDSIDQFNQQQLPGVASRTQIIKATKSPLGFCVIALLIVESFLVGAGVFFGLPEIWKIIALGTGVFLFLVVFGTVVWLVVVHPQNLVFSEQSHVHVAAMRIHGNESGGRTFDINQRPVGLPPQPTMGQLADGSGEK